MTVSNSADWVHSVELPFANDQQAPITDWHKVAAACHDVVPLRNFEPLRPQVPFVQRQGFLPFGKSGAVVVAHNGLRLEGERTRAGMASLRLNLIGRSRTEHLGQTLMLGPGRLLFDYDDNSSYVARTDSQLMMVLLGLEPDAIAAAAAALVGPEEDPEPFLKRLPNQCLFSEEQRSTGIVLRQVLRILKLTELSAGDSAQAGDTARLQQLLYRGLALVLFPEFLRNR